MTTSEDLAIAALAGESLKLRGLCHDLLHEYISLSQCPPPKTGSATIEAIAASLIELLASRTNQDPPSWTVAVAGLTQPIFLVKAANTMPNLRTLCENESPEPLKKRGLLAPPNFLEMA